MRLLPRDEKFFNYFSRQVALISESSALLLEGVTAGGMSLETAATKIKVLEEKGDEVIHEIYTKLNQTFITPLDPEDLHSLSSHLDDVLDGIEDAAHRMVAYHVDPIPARVVEVCYHILACAKALEAAFEALNK